MISQIDARPLPPEAPENVAMPIAPVSPTRATKLPIVLWIVPAIVLILAIFPLPYGYYTFTRIVVCTACTLLAYESYRPDFRESVWVAVFAVAAMLFNPIIPVYFKKEIWIYLDGALAAAIISHLIFIRRFED